MRENLWLRTHSYLTYDHNRSAGFAPPFSMLQASGSQFPPPQHLHSGGGGYQPTFTPSEFPQQGMNCSRSSPIVPIRSEVVVPSVYHVYTENSSQDLGVGLW